MSEPLAPTPTLAEQRDGRPAILMVDKTYSAMLYLKPGDAFEIKLGRRKG
jgi:hypothetical protein